MLDYALAEEYSEDKGVWAADPDNYRPIRKIKDFNPNPLISEDNKTQNIPWYADGENNPNCIGTVEYWGFWENQIDRCIHGYETGGIWIPGRYYYYLNFTRLAGVFGLQYPWYVDLDLEYFRTVEYIKEKQKLGMVSIKARRKGLSEKGQTIISHGLRFTEGYKAGIAAGDDKYVIGFRTKFENSSIHMADEMKLNVLRNNADEHNIGYESINSHGSFEKDGFGGQVRFASMYDKATKLEGEYFNDVILEEAGQFSKLNEAIESIKPALMMGSAVGGSFYVYGTGGNILSSSKDFMELFENAEERGFVPFWVSAKRMLYPFLGNPYSLWAKPDENSEEEIFGMPNFSDWEEWEYNGCEDVMAAEEWVLGARMRYAKMQDKSLLRKHNQSFPLTTKEAFTSSGSNNFNSDLLFKQLHNIYEHDIKTMDYILDWVYETDVNGVQQLKYPLEVRRRLPKESDPEWSYIRIYRGPRDVRNLDVAGVDSYNQDKTNTSKSLGGMAVVRRNDKISDPTEDPGITPVCIYYSRPPKKQQFYEICLKISVYYNLIGNVMMSAEHDFIIEYFLNNGGRKFLAPRPKAFDSPNTQQTHKYGAKMTSESKPKMLGHLQSLVDNYSHCIWFEEILRDLLAYDEENIGTDWDLADALGYAYMRIIDMKAKPKVIEEPENRRFMDELPILGHDNLDEFEANAFKEDPFVTQFRGKGKDRERERVEQDMLFHPEWAEYYGETV